MKLRRRPLSVYNASPDSNSQNSISDQSTRKRQRKYSNRSISDHESDIENRSALLTSDGEIEFEISTFCERGCLESAADDDDDRSSGIQTRSIAAAKRMNNQIEYSESEEEETDECESDEEDEEPVIKHPKTRMVTRQMSLIMNHQIKIKTNVKVQPFVDHTEDTLR